MRKLLLLMALCIPLAAQEPEHFLFDAEDAAHEEFYQRALFLLEQGQQMYPMDARFPRQRGDLYLDQGLYSLALGEYESALELAPHDPPLLSQTALVLGYLDRNEQAVDFLLRLSEFEDYREDALEDLAWAYYKLHRLRDGEALLLRELENKFNRRMSHTLGTIYAGLYEYDLSKKYYMDSIEHALVDGNSYFASIAYYNLSILEYRYYRFEESLAMTDLSLEQRDRGGGHQARAEILELRMDFNGAFAEYVRADEMMDNPLPRKDLARLHTEWGYFDEALQYCIAVENQRDVRWMFNYGIDRQEMERDMAELYRDIYRGMNRRERLLPSPSLWRGPVQQFRRWKYGLLALYHESRFRRFCLEEGERQLAQDNLILGWWTLAQGSRGIRSSSIPYLELARREEVARVPAAAPWYDMEIHREERNLEGLEAQLELFDPQWEAYALSKTLEELVRLLPRRSRSSLLYRQRLYELNPGALLRLNRGLPMEVEVRSAQGYSGGMRPGAVSRRMTRLLGRRNHGIHGPQRDLSVHTLVIQLQEGSMNWYLLDLDNRSVREGLVEWEKLNATALREALLVILPTIYGL